MIPLNAKINLKIVELDQYDRVLGEIRTQGGVNVGQKMLSEGLLVRYPYQRNCGTYEQYEKTAKSQKLGVWSDSSFVLPYEWRRTTLPSNIIGRK